MKTYFLALGILLTGTFAYDEKYDYIDVDAIINDNEVFTSYLYCIMDWAPCTEEYSEDFKAVLPEIIRDACEKCTEIQKEHVRKLVTAVYEKKPDIAVAMKKKFDPNGDYEENFAAFLHST